MMRNRIAIAVGLALVSPACSGDSQGSGPPAVADKVYVADEDGRTISVIDAVTNERLRTIDLDDEKSGAMYMPHNVQAAPDGRSVWVAAPVMEGAHAGADEQAIVIDPATDAIIARIDLGAGLHIAHVVLDAASRYAYVTANEANQVFQIDVSTRQVTKTLDLGVDKAPHGLRVCGDALYIAEMTGENIAIVDPAVGSVAEVPVAGIAVQTGCTPNGKYVFASLYDTREIVRYEISSKTMTRIALPEGAEGPVQIYPSPDSKRLYVCDQGILMDRPASNKLFEIDVEAATVAAAIEVGQGAHGVVVNQDGTRVYVTNIADATVSVVDAASRKVVATVGVGAKPNGIAHWHSSGGMP